ncbi:MAG: HAD-IA family hydrolase [Acidimicrobiia bacterium]|nr:HAD-IA family hydrolase [Acidimicrobiia bacterium]
MSASRAQLVIWDFDGTILDTEWPAYEAAKREYERLDAELNFRDWQDTIGSANHEPWWEHLRRQVGDLGEPDEVVIARFRDYKNTLTDSYDLMPGVQKAFTRLAQLQVSSAVASSSPIDWVERHTTRHGLWDHFTAVATRTDVGAERTKPHPDLFLLAAARAGREPEDCVVIEDSVHGVTAARSAGMSVVAVPNRITTGQDFSHADLVLDSLEQVSVEEVLAQCSPTRRAP